MQEKEPTIHLKTLAVEDDSGPFLVDVELRIADGSMTCVGLKIRSYAASEEEAEMHSDLGIGTRSMSTATVTAGLLRRLRAGELIARAMLSLRYDAEEAARIYQPLPTSYEEWLEQVGAEHLDDSDVWRRGYENEQEFAAHVAERATHVTESTPSTGRPPGRPPIPDEKLRQVADFYNEALTIGDSAPSKYIGRAMGVDHRKIRGWVRKARLKGFLPPTRPGTRLGEGKT